MKMLKQRPQFATPQRQGTLAVQALPAAPAAMQQAQNFSALLGEALARGAGNSAATAAVLPLALRPGTGAELLELQLAVAGRMQRLQRE